MIDIESDWKQAEAIWLGPASIERDTEQEEYITAYTTQLLFQYIYIQRKKKWYKKIHACISVFIAALLMINEKAAIYMLINRWMDKEDIYIYIYIYI